MMRDHERIEELLAAHALGALDAADAHTLRDALAEHGPDCAECRTLERELVEVAGLLPFSLTPIAADPSIVDRILGSGGDDVTVLPEASVADELTRRRVGRAARGTRTWAALIGVAAVIVALVVVAGTVVRSPVQVTSADLSGRLVRFDTAEGVEGSLAMAFTPGQPGAVFWGHGLPDPGEGQTFEIWMIDDGVPIPGGCANPIDGRIALFVDAEIGTTDTMAVTVEPTDCPAEPTSDPVAVAPL